MENACNVMNVTEKGNVHIHFQPQRRSPISPRLYLLEQQQRPPVRITEKYKTLPWEVEMRMELPGGFGAWGITQWWHFGCPPCFPHRLGRVLPKIPTQSSQQSKTKINKQTHTQTKEYPSETWSLKLTAESCLWKYLPYCGHTANKPWPAPSQGGWAGGWPPPRSPQVSGSALSPTGQWCQCTSRGLTVHPHLVGGGTAPILLPTALGKPSSIFLSPPTHLFSPVKLKW